MEQVIIMGFLGINSWTDIRYRKVSLWSVAIFSLVGLLYKGLYQKEIPMTLLGLIPGMLLVVVSRVTREALGMGDALLMLTLGIYLGLEGAVDVLMLGLFAAALWAGILLLVRKKSRDYEFPFVPFLALGYLGRWILCTI